MEGVPVKISEQCRPPNKVHLPATLRTLPPTEPIVQPVTFELETNALHWVQERRRNLLAERTERKSRLELKDEAKRKRKEELAEQAKKLEEERQTREEEERQRLEVEAAKRLVEEEEQLKREEEQRLEEFRRKRHQLQQETPAVADSRASQTADSSQPSTADPAASPPADEAAPAPSPAPAAAQTPDTAAVAVPVSSSASASASTSTTAPAASSVTLPPPATTSSAALPPPAAVSSAGVPPPAASTAAAHSAAASAAAASAAAAAPPAATQSTQVWPAAGAVSSNPFNPFSRPASAVMQPQCWQQQQQGTGAAEPRSGSFNYRDFESQASDPFDSVELKTINDMEELASVFRPPPASAASAAPAPAATQPQLAYSYHHQQQQQHQQPSQHSHHQQHRSQQSQQSQQPQQQQQQYYPHAAGSAAGPNQGGGGTGYGFPHSYVAYPAQSYAQPAYSSIPSKTFPAEQSTYRYPTTGYAYTSAGGREPFPAARPSSFPAASAAGSSGPAASAAYPAVSSAAATGTAGAAAAGAAAAAPAPAQPDARQLQEFYTRYYATPGRASPGLPGLRSSRSVPDLCEEVQREAEGGGGGVAADGGAAKRTKSHTPPPQPTANGPTSAAQVCVPQSEPAADISDPLHGLDPAVKARLQELSQMGFPVDRLRRLHNQFNGDEKQVIEFCLSAQRLEEAGHSPLAAERGLIECDGDLGRAADFLSSLAQLTGLGFPEPRAADALRRSDMHRDRALDLLIQG